MQSNLGGELFARVTPGGASSFADSGDYHDWHMLATGIPCGGLNSQRREACSMQPAVCRDNTTFARGVRPGKPLRRIHAPAPRCEVGLDPSPFYARPLALRCRDFGDIQFDHDRSRDLDHDCRVFRFISSFGHLRRSIFRHPGRQ